MEEYELEHTGCARQEAVLVRGGNRLCGELTVQGAKNSTLPLLAAALLCEGETVLHNCPALSDVHTAVTILRRLGCRCTHTGDTLTVCADGMTRCDIPHSLMREMRSSIVFLGAILSRCGEARLSFPGGCELGPRPIDLHLEALRKLGAEIREEHGCLLCTAPGGLRGGFVSLAFPSVGATENAMLAACGAAGLTRICNAAREPEIVDLQGFLQALGARVTGAGTEEIHVSGGLPLHPGTYRVMPDRIVTATYLCAVASAGGQGVLRGARGDHVEPVTAALSAAGCRVRGIPEGLQIARDGPLRGIGALQTGPYPAFPTDAQPLLAAALAGGTGETAITETIFDHRFRYAQGLEALGAQVRAVGETLYLTGHPLHGGSVEAPDLRGGAALTLAALAAEGESRITGLLHIDRGYEALEQDLAALGADIRRETL